MMTKKLLIAMAAVAAISLLLAACFIESDPDDVPDGPPMGSYSGTDEGSAYGHFADVKVTLTLTNGYITDVIINAQQDENSYGKTPIGIARIFITKANSVEIDTVSGATETSEAIRKAGRIALYKITNGVFGSEKGDK
ncbi:MAG: FMN-binding protein [Treponema sp.]|jgi:fumarate reductase flavoprotein subunit|nr:FMN-binding protein [Treponema sp.]